MPGDPLASACEPCDDGAVESSGPGNRPDCHGQSGSGHDAAGVPSREGRHDELPGRDGRRDNGLSAEHYVVLADLDPRVADALLSDLAEAGIAAYVVPTPGKRGGYLETHLPTRHTDRVFVDARAERGAHTLLDSATATTDLDEDAAWREIVESFAAPSAEPVPPWPVSEDLDGPPLAPPRVVHRVATDFVAAPINLDEEEHFVPPAPPPVPRLRSVTVLALLAIAGGVALLALPSVLDYAADTAVQVLAVCLMLGGFGSLVYRMQDGSDDEDDPDDGAVV